GDGPGIGPSPPRSAGADPGTVPPRRPPPPRARPAGPSPRPPPAARRGRGGRPLRLALRTLRERTGGQVLCVLPVTPDGTRAPELAHAAERDADRIFLTRASGDAAPLDPELWLASFLRPGRVRVLLDRRKALEAALDLTR